MIKATEVGTALFLIAAVVYLTRISGYFLGQRFRHIGRLRPVLEALPGCAMMALIVPALVHGTLIELLALVFVVIVMWRQNNIVVATFGGILILLVGNPALAWLSSYVF